MLAIENLRIQGHIEDEYAPMIHSFWCVAQYFKHWSIRGACYGGTRDPQYMLIINKSLNLKYF